MKKKKEEEEEENKDKANPKINFKKWQVRLFVETT